MSTDFSKWDFGQPTKPKEPTNEELPDTTEETEVEPEAETTETEIEPTKSSQAKAQEPAILETLGNLTGKSSKDKNFNTELWWKTLLATVSEKHVTDILFNAESKEVFIRVNSGLELYQRIGKDNYDDLIKSQLPRERWPELDTLDEIDFAVTCLKRRMRVNIFKTLKGGAAAFRPLPNESIPWRDNGLTQQMMQVIDTTKQGLILVTGPTGSGKCLGKGTPVMKYDGTVVPVETIQQDDVLMGPDGKPRRVLKTNQGKGSLYQITPVKGDPWVCNDAHVMTLKRSIKGTKYREDGRLRNDGEFQMFGKQFRGAPGIKRQEPPQQIADVELKTFIERSRTKKKLDQHWKLWRTGVDFNTPTEIANIPVDHFYYLGLWLGDGTKHINRITNLDQAVIQWVQTYAKKHGYVYKESANEKNPEIKLMGACQSTGRAHRKHPEYKFIIGKNQENFCLKAFLGSCLQSPKGDKYPNLRFGEGEKIIPLWAKTATKEQRLALLAGLLDTDGSLDTNCFDLTNKGKELMESVLFIARSLGLWASPLAQKAIKGNVYWRTCISGDTNIVPTQIPRKKATPRKQKKDTCVTGWTPEPIGTGQFFGFTLDGDGRFLLGDFTVTHNSTTLCSMLEYVNEKHPYHIITIEDPVEYIFHNKKSVIDQREVGEHTNSFQAALRASLRENPDIIFVGEMRDYETARTALMAADTGHLVFATLHTRRVYTTISRLLEMAPESSRPEMRAMLSSSLAMVLCQRLLKKRGGGIWPCREVMMLNPAISSLIKEGKERGISNQLTINQAKGMMEWGKALSVAVESGLISPEEAEKYHDATEDID